MKCKEEEEEAQSATGGSSHLARITTEDRNTHNGSDEKERVDRESANRESMGTDRCSITSGRWYRIHAERGSRDTERSRMDESSVRAGSSQSSNSGLREAF
jgi:hypothetical protein